MDIIIESIANVGFPIAITIYLLVRIKSKLEKLSTSIEKLSNVLNK